MLTLANLFRNWSLTLGHWLMRQGLQASFRELPAHGVVVLSKPGCTVVLSKDSSTTLSPLLVEVPTNTAKRSTSSSPRSTGSTPSGNFGNSGEASGGAVSGTKSTSSSQGQHNGHKNAP